MTGRVRTALLAISPRGLPAAAKNLLLWRRLTRDPEALAIWNQYFDAGEYRRVYIDVAQKGIDPQIHFLLRGNPEYRNPSGRFSIQYYLAIYPEVAASGLNALLHFVLFGKREGRVPVKPESCLALPPDLPCTSESVLFINNEWQRDCPLVSVVIPCFNYGQFIEQAIRSVLNQTFSDFEIVVVEGGSTDSTSVAEVHRLESLGLPKTRFYYRPERHLVGDNRNFGIGSSRGRYICCLDPDDILRPVYLEIAVFIAEVLGYDIVTPSVECFGDSNQLWLLTDAHFPEIMMENQVATAALFRRSAWAHIGGYRDWGIGRAHVCEDWDFWIRLLGHGFKAKSIREPLLKYRVHDASLTNVSGVKLDEQGAILQQANSILRTSARTSDDLPVSILNPWINLGPEQDAPPGFLLALPFVTIGGAEKLLRTLARRIVARGYRLIVITTITLPESVPDDLESFAEITPYVYDLSKLFASDEIRNAFLRYLIHRYAVRTLMLAGCEFVYHLLPSLTHEFPELSIVDQLFNDGVHVENNRRYSLSIDTTVVPSDLLLESLTKRHAAEASSIHVIPHGIELPEERPGPAIELPAAAAGKVIVGFFGRLSIEKAPDLFIEIVRDLATHQHLFFVMTGAGPERESVLAQILKYKLQDRIYAPGFVDDVMPLMRAADVVVLPSRIDGMPLAVLEAQALGKPVVASRVGSLPSMIEDQVTGFLCEIGDVPTFSKFILRLAEDSDLRDRMKAAARQSALRKYGADRMLESYERVFRMVSKSGGKINAASVAHDPV